MSPFHFAVAVSMVCMVPMIFMPSFKRLSWLNLVGCVSTVLVTVTMVFVLSIDADRSRMPVQVCLPPHSETTSFPSPMPNMYVHRPRQQLYVLCLSQCTADLILWTIGAGFSVLLFGGRIIRAVGGFTTKDQM